MMEILKTTKKDFEYYKNTLWGKTITENTLEEIEKLENVKILNNGYSGFNIGAIWFSVVLIDKETQEDIDEFQLYIRYKD